MIWRPFTFTALLSLLVTTAAFAADKHSLTKPVKAPSPARQPVVPKEKKSDVSHALFATNAPILTFKIDVSGRELTALQKENKTYARGTVTVGTNIYGDVGVRLKGNGSFRPLNEKPSVVVKFDHYVPGQKFFGETKIALNNSSQDPTYLADFMGNEMFRDANVPVSRVTHARVIFNGRDVGFYVLVEMHNKEFLKRWFHNSHGNLYEAYLADVDSQMDQDNGTDTSQSDRKKFADIVKIADPADRWPKLQQTMDVDRYISHLICELFSCHTDGYAMNRNNYRIYHNPDTDKFTFLGHGVDWAFGNTAVSMEPPQGSLVTKAVLTAPEGAKLFKERRLTLFTNIFDLAVLTNRVNCLAARMLTVAKNQGESNDFRRCAIDMNNRLVARWQNITNQLFGPPPIALEFNNDGIARLSGWKKKTDKDSAEAVHERGVEGSRHVLRISTTTTNKSCIASWRTRVMLPAGIFSFEGDMRTTGIVAKTNDATGIGAGLRLSMGRRENKVEGDAPWMHVQHNLTNAFDTDVILVCELRALKGEVWFDEDSLRIVKRKN